MTVRIGFRHAIMESNCERVGQMHHAQLLRLNPVDATADHVAKDVFLHEALVAVSQAPIEVLYLEFVVRRARRMELLQWREVVPDPREALVHAQPFPRDPGGIDLARIGAVGEERDRFGHNTALIGFSAKVVEED